MDCKESVNLASVIPFQGEPLSEERVKTMLEEKTGSIWECVSLSSNPRGGFLYTLQPKAEFNVILNGDLKTYSAVFDQWRSIYPAVEPIPSDDSILTDDVPKIKSRLFLPSIRAKVRFKGHDYYKSLDKLEKEYLETLGFNFLDPKYESYRLGVIYKIFTMLQAKMEELHRAEDSTEEETERYQKLYQNAKKTDDALENIGIRTFKEDGNIKVTFPDVTALKANWSHQYPNRPIDIVEVDGIASHEEFMDNYFKRKIVVSKGVEFPHDMFMHVTAKLKLYIQAIEDPSILDLEAQLLQIHKDINLDIFKVSQDQPKDTIIVDIVKALLSAEIDSSLAFQTKEELVAEVYSFNLFSQLDSPLWKKYFERQFPDQDINVSSLTQRWENAKHS